MATRSYNLFFVIRLTLLLVMLVLAILGWRFVQNLGGPTQIIPELLRVHLEREATSSEAEQARIRDAIEALSRRETFLAGKLNAVRTIAEIGLERKKSYITSGLSMSYGQIGAEVRIANVDNSDLFAALDVLERIIRHENERLRLEVAFALANIQLYERHANLVPELQRALQDEYSVAIKTYIASALGDIGPPAKRAREELSGLLQEDEPRLLASAARAFARIGPGAYNQRIEENLIMLLNHESAIVRESSAEALGAIGALSLETERALRALIGDPDAHVRVAAALGLADLALTDSAVTAALADGYTLRPRTTLFVEDVARTFESRERVAEYFARLGQVPDVLVPTLVEIVKQTHDIEKKEELLAIIANTDEFSTARVDALLELLQDPRFGFYYAVVDGLVSMGPEVLPQVDPLLEHEQIQVRQLAEEIRRKLEPPRLKSAPAADATLIASFEAATDSFARQEIATTMAESGAPEMLQYILDHRDVRVLNGPVYDVVVARLVGNLRQYGFSATHDQQAKRLALRSLNYLGVLSDPELSDFLLVAEEPDVGDRVREIWYEFKRGRGRPPSLEQVLDDLYAKLATPRNKDIQRLAEELKSTDPNRREAAIKGVQKIVAHAVEAPPYLVQAMQDPSERVRRTALNVYVSNQLTTVAAMDVLSAILLNTDQSDRLNHDAAIGLAQIGPPALAVLQDAAEDEAVAVRRAAAFGLLKMGTDALPARALLESLAKDPHRGVSTYAQNALDGLGGAQ